MTMTTTLRGDANTVTGGAAGVTAPLPPPETPPHTGFHKLNP